MPIDKEITAAFTVYIREDMAPIYLIEHASLSGCKIVGISRSPIMYI